MHDALEDFMLQMENHGIDPGKMDRSMAAFIKSTGFLEYQRKKNEPSEGVKLNWDAVDQLRYGGKRAK